MVGLNLVTEHHTIYSGLQMERRDQSRFDVVDDSTINHPLHAHYCTNTVEDVRRRERERHTVEMPML